MITFDEFEAIADGATDGARMKFYSPLVAAMEEFNIITAERITAFLAQILHESGNLRYVKEIASGSAYEHRKDLGNLDKRALKLAHAAGTTTGRFYRGRGLIQITGYYNFLKAEVALGIPCTENPSLLSEPINACRSAAWFFESHGCNGLADAREFDRITTTINGGLNGKKERDIFYSQACLILEV